MEETPKSMGAAPIGAQPEPSTPRFELTERRRLFCEGIARGLSVTEAYREAYPGVSCPSASTNAGRLLRMDVVKAEVARLRTAADQEVGSAVLDCAKKRRFLARVLRANISTLDATLDGDLLEVCEMDKGKLRLRLFDKIRAIELDNDLAGEGSEAEALDEVGAMLRRIMMENVPAHRQGGRIERPPSFTLTGPQRLFCEGIVRGQSTIEAYRAAFPRANEHSVRTNAYRMFKKDRVKAEIERLKAAAAKLAGAEALSREEKQRFMARLIHVNLATLNPALDGDLLQSYEAVKGKLRFRLADKLRAIALDNDRADDGGVAESNADFYAWADRVKKSKEDQSRIGSAGVSPG
jgi:phage terminase small subunit